MMNQSGFDEVNRTLKEYLEDTSIYSPKVLTAPSGAVYPMVIVEEIENSQLAHSTEYIDSISLIGIEINIYADSKTVGVKKIAGRTIARELSSLCDAVCTGIYGMKRISCKPAPNIDNTLYRIVMRFNAMQNDNRSVFY